MSEYAASVVHEPVDAIQALDELEADRLPKVGVDFFLGRPTHERERSQGGAVAEASELLQRLSRHERQPGQFGHHEVRDVGRVRLRVDARDVPRPTLRGRIEREQLLVDEGREELDDEEGVAASLRVHQLRQRGGARRLAANCIRDELTQIIAGQRT
jgi:hypothetical protein